MHFSGLAATKLSDAKILRCRLLWLVRRATATAPGGAGLGCRKRTRVLTAGDKRRFARPFAATLLHHSNSTKVCNLSFNWSEKPFRCCFSESFARIRGLLNQHLSPKCTSETRTYLPSNSLLMQFTNFGWKLLDYVDLESWVEDSLCTLYLTIWRKNIWMIKKE